MLKAVETVGIFAQEKCFFLFCQLLALTHEIITHTIGYGCDGTWLVATPHQMVHTHPIGCLTNASYGCREWIEL